MAFSRTVLSVLLLSVVCKASVPVFLWGDLAAPTLKANPLNVVTTPAFSDILSEELANDQFVVVFIDEKLSNEDLSQKIDGETAFPYLHANVKKSIYLPAVQNPVEAFYMLDDAENVDSVVLTGNGPLEIVPSETLANFAFVSLNDAQEGESRAELLRRHNDFIEETVAKLKKEHGSVVAVYTGRKSSSSRVRRQAQGNSNILINDLALNGVRLYVKSIRVTEGDSTVEVQGYVSASSEINSTATGLSTKTTLNFSDRSIVLNFIGGGGYWFLDSVTMNPGTSNAVDLGPKTEIFAPLGFAYRCAQNVTYSSALTNTTVTLTTILFEDLKVQAQFTPTNESSPVVFGDSYNCVGFFSAPIWAGIFVVFILLSITFFGIMMMLDMKAMDRFDDPKGKTININAQE